jgi:hypothetical protein
VFGDMALKGIHVELRNCCQNNTPSLHLCVPPIQFSPIPRTLDLYISLSLPFSLSATVHTDAGALRPLLHLELRPGDIIIVSAKSSPSLPPSAGLLQALSACTTPLMRLRCRGQAVLHWVLYFYVSQFRPCLGALFF